MAESAAAAPPPLAEAAPAPAPPLHSSAHGEAARAPPPPLYSSAAGEAALRELYTSSLSALPFVHDERWVATSFGRAHVLVCGPADAPPLLVWHGTAAPGPFQVATLEALVPHFQMYTPDIPCQAGSRSDPAALEPASHDYAKWAVEVMHGLGLLDDGSPAGGSSSGGTPGGPAPPPWHIGVSLGGAVLLDIAVHAPETVGGALLMVPGSLHPDSAKPWMPLSAALSFALYRWLPCRATGWLVWAAMADEPGRQEPVYQNVLLGIRYANYFPAIPGPFTDDQLRRLAAPTLVVGAERDVFGPGAGTLARAQAVFPRCETLLIPSSKHVPAQAKWDEAMQRILRFCREHGGLPAGGGAE